MRVFYLLISVFFSANLIAQKEIISLWQKGNVAAKYSNNESLEHYEKAFELAKKQNNFAWQANILTDISGAYYGLGEYEKGAESCELGLKIMKQHNLVADSIQFKLYSALAANQKNLYKLNEAQLNYAIANKIIQANPKLESQIPLYAAYHFSNQGAFWLKLQDTQQSKIYYEKALSISKNIQQKGEFALILANLSKFYFISQDYKEGIKLQKNAIDFYKKTLKYSPLELAKMYFMLGLFYTKDQNFSEAKANYMLCRDICKPQKKIAEFQHHHDAANLEIIRIAILKNQLQEAKSSLEKLQLSQLSPSSIYNYWEIYGKYHHQNHNYIESINCHATALKTNSDGYNDNDDLIRVFDTKQNISKAYLELYMQTNKVSHLQNSLSVLNNCIEIGKLIRQNFYSLESKLYFTDKYYSIYKDAINLTYLLYSKTKKQNLLQQAFALAEESKSVILLDKQTLNTNARNASSDSLMLKLNAYQAYLSFLKNQPEKNNEAISEYDLKVTQTLEKIKFANQALAKFYQPNVIDITKMQQSLPSDALYINYIIHQNDLFVLAANKNELFFRKLNLNKSAYHSHLATITKSLSTPPDQYTGFSAYQSCEFFYDLFLGNIFKELHDYKRLIINPDNSFYDVSFDILRSRNTQKFLIENHAITYTNSLESVISKPLRGKRISEKWNVFLPVEANNKVLESGLKPLKFSFAEVKGILSDLFKNNLASKNNFLTKLQTDSTKIIMISTYAKAEKILEDLDKIENPKYDIGAMNRAKVRTQIFLKKHF